MNGNIVRIAVFGAAGRMGQALIRCLGRFPRLSLVGAVESAGFPDLGGDVGLSAGSGRLGVCLSSEAREAAAPADVLIDFSIPSAAVEHAALAMDLRKGFVLGTTGLDRGQASDITKASETVPVVWAPNMSMGMNLLFDLVGKAAGILRGYDIEIVETHHRHKKDAPSGTALRLVEAAAAARDLDPESVATHGRCGMTGERPADRIGVHALRAGDVAGDHTVMLAGDGERVELGHRASGRECFAAGALRAAEWVSGRDPGLYDMRHVLDLCG